MTKSLKVAVLYSSIIFLSITSLYAQDRVKEVGVGFYNLDDFSLVYRFGTEKSLYRLGAFINYTGSNEEQIGVSNESDGYRFGVSVGKEFRKELATNLQFRYGADFFGQWGKDTQKIGSQEGSSTNSMISLNGVVGIIKHFDSGVDVGVEMAPNISFLSRENSGTGNEFKAFEIDISTLSPLMSLTFSF